MKKAAIDRPMHPSRTVKNWIELSTEQKAKLRTAHAELMDVYNASIEYDRKDFCRRRSWVVFRRTPGGSLLGYSGMNSGKSTWSESKVRVFTSNSVSVNKEFSLRDYRRKNKKNKVDMLNNFIEGLRKRYTKDDIFLSRVGSSKCPVRFDWTKVNRKLLNNGYDFILPFERK